MVMLPVCYKYNRKPSYVLIETFLCIFLGMLLFFPAFDWVIQRNLYHSQIRRQESSRINLDFTLSIIQEELTYAKWATSDFRPLNNQTSTLLSFKTFDEIQLIRFYLVGQEIVKDINYTTYNAITQKTIDHFTIKRMDIANYYSILVEITDIYGYTTNKIFTTKKRI